MELQLGSAIALSKVAQLLKAWHETRRFRSRVWGVTATKGPPVTWQRKIYERGLGPRSRADGNWELAVLTCMSDGSKLSGFPGCRSGSIAKNACILYIAKQDLSPVGENTAAGRKCGTCQRPARGQQRCQSSAFGGSGHAAHCARDPPWASWEACKDRAAVVRRALVAEGALGSILARIRPGHMHAQRALRHPRSCVT